MNIVLVHGILGFTREAGVDYFRGVAEQFREKALRVLVPALDPTHGIALRGTQLRLPNHGCLQSRQHGPLQHNTSQGLL